MNNKNKIIDHLQLTSEQYDERLFQIFWCWCQKFGKTTNHSQQLLANHGIAKWWHTEYEKIEAKFIEAIPYLPLHTNNLEYHYFGFIDQMKTIYPKPLIDAISASVKKEEIKIIKQLPTYYAN